jgi:hypothetical protein
MPKPCAYTETLFPKCHNHNSASATDKCTKDGQGDKLPYGTSDANAQGCLLCNDRFLVVHPVEVDLPTAMTTGPTLRTPCRTHQHPAGWLIHACDAQRPAEQEQALTVAPVILALVQWPAQQQIHCVRVCRVQGALQALGSIAGHCYRMGPGVSPAQNL